MKKILRTIVQISMVNFLVFAIFFLFSKKLLSLLSPQQTPTSEQITQPFPSSAKPSPSIKARAPRPPAQPTSQSTSVPTTKPSSAPTANPTSLPTPTEKPSALSQVALHNTPSDCWMSYRGHAYNVTPFFGSHPGGDATLTPYCGKNIDQAFDTKGKNPPSPHSANAAVMLQQYLIQ